VEATCQTTDREPLKFEAEIVLAPDMGLSMRLPPSHRNYFRPTLPRNQLQVGPARGHMGVTECTGCRGPYAVGQLHRQDARIDANEANCPRVCRWPLPRYSLLGDHRCALRDDRQSA